MVERLKRLWNYFILLTKACYYVFTLLGLFFLYIDVLKVQAAAANPDWYVYLVFIFFVLAVIYAALDIGKKIIELSRKKADAHQ